MLYITTLKDPFFGTNSQYVLQGTPKTELEEELMKRILELIQEKEISNGYGWTITICDEGKYYTFRINDEPIFAFNKTIPNIYSNNYDGFIELKKLGQKCSILSNKDIDMLFYIVKQISSEIKEIQERAEINSNKITKELIKHGFEIKTSDNNVYIICEDGYEVGEYDGKHDKLTCYTFDGNDDYKLLRAKEDLLNFMLCKKETPENIG